VHTGRTLTLSQLPKIPDAIVRDRSTPKNKTTKNMKPVIIKLTREYASGQRESWHKSFTEIDNSQLGARAFAGGAYLKPGEHRLEMGTLVLHVVPMGSVKNGSEVAEILRATEAQTLEPLTERFQWREQQCTIQDMAATLLGVQPPIQDEYRTLSDYSEEELELELRKRRKIPA
jgi:hypothetical protein